MIDPHPNLPPCASDDCLDPVEQAAKFNKTRVGQSNYNHPCYKQALADVQELLNNAAKNGYVSLHNEELLDQLGMLKEGGINGVG